MDAAVGLEPRLEGMNLVSYLLLHHCYIYQGAVLTIQIYSQALKNELLFAPFL